VGGNYDVQPTQHRRANLDCSLFFFNQPLEQFQDFQENTTNATLDTGRTITKTSFWILKWATLSHNTLLQQDNENSRHYE